MTQEHANHEYGFFKEMATKYREKFASEMSMIKTQESSVSSALQEIASEEHSLSIGNHAQKCQADDIEQVFDELISASETAWNFFCRLLIFSNVDSILMRKLRLADAKMCTIDSLSFANASLYVGEQTLMLTLRDSRGNTSAGENDIKIHLLPPQGNPIIGETQPISQEGVSYSIHLRTAPTSCKSKWSSHQV